MAGSTITRGAALSVQANLAASALISRGNQIAINTSAKITNYALPYLDRITKGYVGYQVGTGFYDGLSSNKSSIASQFDPILPTNSALSMSGYVAGAGVKYTASSIYNAGASLYSSLKNINIGSFNSNYKTNQNKFFYK